jgi:hypothetical protein
MTGEDAARAAGVVKTEGIGVGARGRLRGAPGHPSELRGLTGTVKGKWANPWAAPEDLVLEVRLEDGHTRLFWSNELEGVAEAFAERA